MSFNFSPVTVQEKSDMACSISPPFKVTPYTIWTSSDLENTYAIMLELEVSCCNITIE